MGREGEILDLPCGPLLQDQRGETVRVFTTRPETVFGASYIAVATNHKLVSQLQVILLYYWVRCGGRGLVWWEGPPFPLLFACRRRTVV